MAELEYLFPSERVSELEIKFKSNLVQKITYLPPRTFSFFNVLEQKTGNMRFPVQQKYVKDCILGN